MRDRGRRRPCCGLRPPDRRSQRHPCRSGVRAQDALPRHGRARDASGAPAPEPARRCRAADRGGVAERSVMPLRRGRQGGRTPPPRCGGTAGWRRRNLDLLDHSLVGRRQGHGGPSRAGPLLGRGPACGASSRRAAQRSNRGKPQHAGRPRPGAGPGVNLRCRSWCRRRSSRSRRRPVRARIAARPPR